MIKNLNENKETMVGNILFKEDKEKTKEMITQMWNYRAGIKKRKAEKNQDRKKITEKNIA